jgi:hypothetical protein
MIDFSKHLFRCSSIGTIMTNGTGADKDKMGKTCKSKLHEIYKELTTHRKREYSSKYIDKGIRCEEDALTLLSRYKKQFFVKNKERINNKFLSGEPDIIATAEGFDTKCSWDIWTFPDFENELDKGYEGQNHGYIALAEKEKWTTVYCLVNAPTDLIDKEKKFIYYELGMPEDTNPDYIERCIEVEKNMIFDMKAFKAHNPYYDLACKEWTYDLPIEERIKEFVTERSQAKLDAIYQRVEECRGYLIKIQESRNRLQLAS